MIAKWVRLNDYHETIVNINLVVEFFKSADRPSWEPEEQAIIEFHHIHSQQDEGSYCYYETDKARDEDFERLAKLLGT